MINCMTSKFTILKPTIASLSSISRIKTIWLVVACISFFSVFEVRAQSSTFLNKVQTKQNETAKGVLSSVGEQLAAAKGRLAEARAEFSGVDDRTRLSSATPEEADEYKRLRVRLIQLYELQTRALEQIQILDTTADELRKQIASWTGFAEPQPDSLDFSDGLWKEIKNKEQYIRPLQMALLLFENDLADSKEQLKPEAVAMQQSAEQLNEIKPGEDTARPSWLLGLNQLRMRVAEVKVAANEMERRMINSRIVVKQVEHDFLIRKLDEADAHIHFSKQELSNKIDKLDQERLVIQKEIERARRDDQSLYFEHSQAQERLERLKKGGRAPVGMVADAVEKIGYLEQSSNLFALRTEDAAMRGRVLLEMERLIGRIQSVWKERFVLMNAPSADMLKASLISLQAEQARFEQQRDILLSIQAAIQKKLLYEQSRSKDPDLAAGDREQSRKLAKTYRQQFDVWMPLQVRLEKFGDLLERARQQAETRSSELSFKDRARNLVSMADEALRQLTDFEIYSVTDTITVEGEEISGMRRVTLGQILMFLLIITAGFWLSASAVHLSMRGAKYVFRLNVDSAALFARVAHIVLALGVAAAALTTMKIPLAVFAFLGGAMALAIGFGAQNLLNNFVSGLILLIERPVKTGDIVDVEGVTGRITQIGARCCEIRRMDGVEMLVPNSAMIEKTVTNWTLSDQKRRASVTIGIAYGSPVEQTQSLIEAAVRAHPDVLSNPDPLVLFENFGESALIFTVYYWLDLAHVADRLVVASEIRVSLNRRLTEAGIIIAYPQRDVHLHTVRPLEVVIGNPAAGNPDVESKL